MKKIIIQTIKILLFIGLGVFLFWKVYKDQPVEELVVAAKKLNYGWIILAAAIGLLSHWVRAMRWKVVFHSMKRPVKTSLLYHSVIIGYLANYAFPRMGEVSRAAVLKKYNGIPFTVGFGTIVNERIVDVLIMGIFTLIGLALQPRFFVTFINDNPAISDRIGALITWQNILILLAIGVFGLAGLWFLGRKSKAYQGFVEKIVNKINSFKEGLFSILSLQQPAKYIAYSFLTWILYFVGMWATLPAFYPLGMSSIGVVELFLVFIMGIYAMLAPVQGGIGAYHFMVIASLVIYGIDDATARLFALVVHGTTTIVVVLGGLVSLALLSYGQKVIPRDTVEQ